jgi:trehalose 6-phosphate phosphatase
MLDRLRIHKLHPRLRPADACLFLDVDGTLIEFGPSPDAVHVDKPLMQLLHRAAVACDGAVALISGRSLTQLDALFAPRRWPAAGLHGAERRDADGQVHVHPTERVPSALLEELQAVARRHPGLLLEDKGRAVALHYRHAADLKGMLEHEVHRIAQRHGELDVQPGAYVLEVKPSGITKAHAIEAFMVEEPFAGRVPLFAGDDLTDLHGFEAVEQRGGISIAVGPRVKAMLEVPSPADLRALLEEFVTRRVCA